MPVKAKSSLAVLCCSLAVFFSTNAQGQAAAAATSPASVPSKIAFVNIQEAVVTCNEGKQDSAALTQRFSTKQAALKTQDDELKKLKDDFQATGDKLNEEQRAARLKAIQDKQKAFERNYADYQAETQEAQQEAVNKIVKKMLPVLEKYVLANGYTAVFDISNPQTPVLWVRRESMITKQLVEAYNAQPAATSLPAPAPSGTAPKP
jgi:outer membrane protein